MGMGAVCLWSMQVGEGEGEVGRGRGGVMGVLILLVLLARVGWRMGMRWLGGIVLLRVWVDGGRMKISRLEFGGGFFSVFFNFNVCSLYQHILASTDFSSFSQVGLLLYPGLEFSLAPFTSPSPVYSAYFLLYGTSQFSIYLSLSLIRSHSCLHPPASSLNSLFSILKPLVVHILPTLNYLYPTSLPYPTGATTRSPT